MISIASRLTRENGKRTGLRRSAGHLRPTDPLAVTMKRSFNEAHGAGCCIRTSGWAEVVDMAIRRLRNRPKGPAAEDECQRNLDTPRG
jgi:hypothetical protein